ncbi:LLM class F420-dependent oxidoreductase [Pseudonocardia endophytica]|uniref:Alkanesulfonate monooxygenase n=1 Tax=Pseudonocardia endophytica TaxID=401976 RepID=A0A4R1HJY4_PSEEN|nr:LLM class F420-dependent oxidoreductase [Pseudonocardia endophytica]TCK22168.1 alkanesulfonate monooxygenase [Pseudonocardia endophytica]
MKIGLQLSDFTVPGGPPALATTLRRVATVAEDAGFARLAVADHLWQIPANGSAESEMLEAYTTLGFLAACTSRVELLTWVSAVTFREPALLTKCVTTLDVLSGGRAWLGVGAGWYADEARGLGLPFPPTAERFDRLEETLQICLQMWSDEDKPYAGRHYTLERTLNAPQPLRRPPILVAGGGERRTLRLVARYADACNLFASPELERKLDVLREHCAAVGRDYDDIEKTVVLPLDPGPRGEHVGAIVDELDRLARMGFTHAHGRVPGAAAIAPLDLFGERIIPAAAAL